MSVQTGWCHLGVLVSEKLDVTQKPHWDASKAAGTAGPGRGFCTSASSGGLCPALGSWVQNRRGTLIVAPEEGHENGQRAGRVFR